MNDSIVALEDDAREIGGAEEEAVLSRSRPEHLGRPVEKATRQFALLVFTEVLPDKLEELRALLRKIGAQTMSIMRGAALGEPAILPFLHVKTIHYARFVLVERGDEGLPTHLAFSTNYDGPLGEENCSESVARDQHLDELIREAGDTLEQIYGYCVDRGQQPLKRYLEQHLVPAATFYVGSPGRSCQQILWESDLRRDINKVIDRGRWHAENPREVREAVSKDLKMLPQYTAGIPDFPAQPELAGKVDAARRMVIAIACAVVAAFLAGGWYAAPPLKYLLYGGPAILALVGCLLAFGLRRLEDSDPQFQIETSAKTHEAFEVASDAENWFLQNQLSHLVNIKPGPLRWALIRLVFKGLQLLATNVYNKGKLGDIPSIHFARWVLIPDRGVLFFSNFDNSWQSYLGDFIDKASAGLTAVWSNTVGYPRTKWLLKAGSRDAARFLAWTRAHQIPTQVWYCAYPGLSIVNVNDNTELRRGLARPSSMDAASWLFRLRSVNTIAADQLYSAEQAREPSLPLGQIQGLILKGYGHKPDARYLLFKVSPRSTGASGRSAGLRRWLSQLPLTSAAEAPRAVRHVSKQETFVNVAFTCEGLRALGVDPALCDSFSTPFVQGSDHEYRVRVVGDVGENSPKNWAWGSRDRGNEVHVALLVFADARGSVENGKAPVEIACFGEDGEHGIVGEATAAGLELVTALSGTLLADRKEHFGFRDGIAQPVVAGSGRVEVEGNTVPAGEFLLGHRDGYGNVAQSPATANGFNFGMNGSYLVFRQLEQNVEAFWAYCDAESKKITDPDNQLSAVTVASKMVGRWPSGAPLVRHPDKDPEDPRYVDDDSFTYLGNDTNNDRYGARCPFGAHVRRANPRDWALGTTREESLTLSARHRIIRRGRPYGPPLDEAMRAGRMIEIAKGRAGEQAGERRGLNFLCFNANLDRQFEFVQQQWCANPNFAGLNGGSDPLVGAMPIDQLELDPATFTIQHHKRGDLKARLTELPSFVRVVGSAYLFMPSIPAIRLLGGDALLPAEAPALESPPPDEQIHIDSLIDTLRAKMKADYADKKTLRDAHPKMHGLVRAKLTVEAGLEDALRVGLFAEPRTYRALVRFSNADGAVGPDSKRDIRGVAIKLLDVPGTKLLDGDEDCTTHDLLLISHDVFVVRDVAGFEGLIQAIAGDKLAMPRYLASHPRVAWQVLTSLGRHASLLEIDYFSVSPYLFGRRAVKYALRPRGEAKARIPSHPSDDYLRAALKADLEKKSATFDFMVQVQGDPERMPVEDPSVRWTERESPFKKIATLEILRQTFDSEEQEELGENLSFNPWRALPEHRPLGGISRARRQVYLALSTFRHDRNSTPTREPTLEDWNALAPESEREIARPAEEQPPFSATGT